LTHRIHLPTPLRRAGDLELERNRRSGRSFSLLLLRLQPGGRSRRARRVAYARLRSLAEQHLRPFDHVDVVPADGLLGVVAHDADVGDAERIGERLAAAVAGTGCAVAGVGAATYPADGLLLGHLVDRAMERLDAPASDAVTATAGVTGHGSGR
jgi:hypothetical protein